MTNTKTWTGRAFIGASLDGFIARPQGDIDWLTDSYPRPHADIDSSHRAETWETFFPGIDHAVMGRGTYEKVLTFGEWPYAGKRVLVISTTLTGQDDRITVVRTVDEACAALAHGHAGQVYVDGGKVIQAFLRDGLIDELTVSHAPVLIGSGISLFGLHERDVNLILRGSHASDGMVHATYDVENLSAEGGEL